MMDDPGNFNKYEYESLFGRNFLLRVLEEASEEETMDKHRRSNRPPKMFRSDFSRMSQTGHSYYRSFKSSSRGSYNNRYVDLDTFKVGARLSLFIDYWHYSSNDTWVLNTVKFGFKLSWMEDPFQESIPVPCSMSNESRALCDSQIKELLDKNAIIEIPLAEQGFISNLFIIYKSSGGFRLIFNLKELNKL